jgi:hypothetical protein
MQRTKHLLEDERGAIEREVREHESSVFPSSESPLLTIPTMQRVDGSICCFENAMQPIKTSSSDQVVIAI